jgi:hypothetical protein
VNRLHGGGRLRIDGIGSAGPYRSRAWR